MNQIDFTKPVQTRDGRKVRILCTDANSRYPVRGLITQPAGETTPEQETSASWQLDGKLLDGCENDADLVQVKNRIRRTFFVNIYRHDGGMGVHSLRADADIAAGGDRIACVPIHIDVEEGHGL